MHGATFPRFASRATALAVVSATWALVAATACSPYQAGTINALHRGSTTSIGCLDIAADALVDDKAKGPAVKLFVGNHCDAGVTVDYQAIFATVRYSSGARRTVRIFDPKSRLRPVMIDGRRQVWEAFEFEPDHDPGPGPDPDDARIEDTDLGAPEQLCLEVSQIAPEQPGQTEQNICVEAI